MSPWEVIGWTIAIPMVLFAGLFVFAVLGSIVRAIAKRSLPKSVKDVKHPAGRHLRIVEDD